MLGVSLPWYIKMHPSTQLSLPALCALVQFYYMADFQKIFGYYPKSAGSWFIDAHTLKYMHDKYGITASCNCKDQIGTGLRIIPDEGRIILDLSKNR